MSIGRTGSLSPVGLGRYNGCSAGPEGFGACDAKSQAESASVLFSKRLPLSSLITLCHTLRHNLGAGLPLARVFRQQAERGPLGVRPIAARIAPKLEKGDDLESALKAEEHHFPPLFLSMASIGEESGSLPEVFTELEKYYMLQQKLKRQFISQISWPIFQLVIAIGTITMMILVIGMLASNPEEAYDPLGFGVGPGPAVRFLAIVILIFVSLVGIYFGSKHLMRQKGVIDEFLLRLLVIGPCIRAFALTRLCIGLRLTMETGMPITRAVDLSLRATDNDAFISKSEKVRDALSEGEELAASLKATRLFPEDFENILANAEEAGRMNQVLEHQAKYYEEESSRRLTVLATVAGWGVWLIVAIFLVIMILKMAFKYLGLLDPAKYGIPQ
jgi:type II secretory pathway component PulF